ncbi:MAG: cupin domain-containing protein [Agriterribacter sp.]
MKRLILFSTFLIILPGLHAQDKITTIAAKSNVIHKQPCIARSSHQQILPNEIEEIETYFTRLRPKESFKYKVRPDCVSIFLMTNGKAFIQQGATAFNATGLNLFVPSRNEAMIVADKEGLSMLEIVVRLTSEEMKTFEKQTQVLPYFVDYTKCRQYREAIKSEKTISRMILPENIVPRFCMGSVQTTGIDEVGEHKHPILEQLFYGLSGNDCVVSADSVKTDFRENELLHIPLGSKHGVKVEQGKILNYIWMDHFRSADDMRYIKDNHIMKDEK